MKKLLVSGFAVFVLAIGTHGFAATIQVTGGTLTADASASSSEPAANQTTPMGTAPGVYRADASTAVGSGHVKVDDTTNAFRIDENAFGHSTVDHLGSGSGSATIDFVLSAPVTVKLSFQQSFVGFNSSSKVVLTDAASNILTICDRFIGNCSATSLDLLAGTYHIDARVAAGADQSTSISFTMTPVPLPLAAWLLCSGLAGVLGIGVRRRQAS